MGASLLPGRRWYAGALLFTATLLLAAACGTSGSNSSSTGTGAVKSGGTLTFAPDEDVAGFNVLSAGDQAFVLAEILDQVWPKVFVVQPDLKPVLNTNVVTSARVTSTNPQTVVYHINPKATWSDGTPISAADFIYNWQAQSGSPKYTDVGGKDFLPATSAGFSQIKSVTSSAGGKTATVVFSSPYGDWQSLFVPLIPAHVADKVGFNTGFQTFGPAVQVSGGPYEIQSYAKGEDLVEVRNPHYWGPRGHLSKIVFRFLTDDNQAAPAIQNGEANMVNPALASIAYYDAVRAIPKFTVKVDPGLEFQHIDFNEANPYLAKLAIRQAIAYGTDRKQMVQRLVDPMSPGVGPLENRIFMATQPQYKNTSGSFGAFDPVKAKALLKGAGMIMGADGYFQPGAGPQKGKDFTLSISTTSGVPVRQSVEELFQADMKTIGIKINIQNYDANTLFGTILPKGEYDISEFAWVLSPFASANQPLYCSFTDASLCGSNWDHYANPQVDKLFDQALGTVNQAQAAAIYNQVDSVLWKDMVTLPLFQQPQLFGWSSNYGNIVPNTSSIGIPWNASLWGLTSS